MAKVGICFGGYCPLHQGHMDLIMNAKKENDICYVLVCGYDGEERAEEIGLPLRRRISLVRQTFKGDEQIRVLEVNDTKLGIDESMSDSNWDIWLGNAYRIIADDLWEKGDFTDLHHDAHYTWYVAEPSYETGILEHSYIEAGTNDFVKVRLFDRTANPVSGTAIRENPLKYWNKIALPFRAYFSTNILITGTASEGKSTLTRDIAAYFGIPYSEEYGRTYMAMYSKNDTDLTVNDFLEFLIGQRRDTKEKIESAANQGIVISDTDNLVTLMYAQAYADDDDIDLTWDDFKVLEGIAKNMQRGISWDKIFLIEPHNVFVDDGCRYMKQSSMDERRKNYTKLVKLIKKFGWWDKVTVINGTYLENFETVKNYIKEKIK